MARPHRRPSGLARSRSSTRSTSSSGRGHRFRKQVVQRSPDHHLDQLALVGRGRRSDRADVAAVAQHGHAVGDGGRPRRTCARCRSWSRRAALSAAMTSNRRSISLSTQRRRRLVEDEQPGVEREGLGDFDELLLADPQPLDRPVWSTRGTLRRASSAAASRCMRRRRASRQRLRGSRPRKMFSATVSSGMRLSSWWMVAMPRRWASRGPVQREWLAIEETLAVVVRCRPR